jgi:hypothetical protein
MDKTKFFHFLSYSLKMLLSVLIFSFIIDVGYRFYKTSNFSEAFNYWVSLFFSGQRILIWVIVSCTMGLIRVYFTKKKNS